MTKLVARFSRLGLLTALLTACSSDDVTVMEVVPPPPPPPPPAVLPVVISEIMFHPPAENAATDNHEFVEIYNRGSSAVDLAGWSLTGNINYTFPAGATIAAQGYKVIAKNRTALASISSYMLSAPDLFGDYAGELDNGSGQVNLVNAQSAVVDSVKYNDSFPWPMGTDALGAGDDWLGLLPNPTTEAAHQYRGRSLERVAFDVPASDISNWVPSPLDGATPGRPNSQSGAPPTIVLTKKVTWSGTDVLIRAADTVKIGVTFSTLGSFSAPKLQYFVDNVQITGEPITTVDLTLNNGVYEATLPPQPDNSIVRYRIAADLGAGQQVLSPRASDPLEWWAYFVTPQVATTAPMYQLFIKKENWNQIYDNVDFATDDRRVSPGGSAVNRCLPRASWDSVVPAVFILDGIVYDTFVRYQEAFV